MSEGKGFEQASLLLYNLAKQGTHQKAIRNLLIEDGYSENDFKKAVDAYIKEERSGAFRSIIIGCVLWIISIALTVITLMPSVRSDYVRVWPWGFLVGAWMLVSGSLRIRKIMTFKKTR